MYWGYRDVLYWDGMEILFAFQGLFQKFWEIMLWTIIHIFLVSGELAQREYEVSLERAYTIKDIEDIDFFLVLFSGKSGPIIHKVELQKSKFYLLISGLIFMK